MIVMQLWGYVILVFAAYLAIYGRRDARTLRDRWQRSHTSEPLPMPPLPRPRLMLVVAGNYWQFQEFCIRHELSTNNRQRVRYMSVPAQLYGYDNVDVYFVGTYWHSAVYQEPYAMNRLRSRPGVRLIYEEEGIPHYVRPQ